jgi:hypothetical protein
MLFNVTPPKNPGNMYINKSIKELNCSPSLIFLREGAGGRVKINDEIAQTLASLC